MRVRATILALLLTLFLAYLAPTYATSHCPFEDAACWDCTTMGNLICGEGA